MLQTEPAAAAERDPELGRRFFDRPTLQGPLQLGAYRAAQRIMTEQLGDIALASPGQKRSVYLDHMARIICEELRGLSDEEVVP